jgi:hypothetical protein
VVAAAIAGGVHGHWLVLVRQARTGEREACGWEIEDLDSTLDLTGMRSGEGDLGSQQICWVE